MVFRQIAFCLNGIVDKFKGEEFGEMIVKSVRQAPVFSEFTQEEQERYFSLSDRKVTNHVDTMYYSCTIFGDSNQNENVAMLLQDLHDLRKQKADCYANEVDFFGLSVECTRFVHYEYCLRLNEMFDIFVSSTLPNVHTPRVVVQLRTRSLILDGVCQAICKSFRYVETILLAYGLEVEHVNENRIDYAYHTNLIQNPTKYFSDEVLLKKLKTKLRKYQKVGEIGKTVDIDYLSFGMRNSNNIFVRMYNKSREVIEKNYKSFFIEKWLSDKLISNYDYYVYQKAYAFGSYVTGLLLGRIEWYLEYGTNDLVRKELEKVKISCYQDSDNTDQIRKIVDHYLPPVTLVLNIEFQTKRRFYVSMNEWIEKFGIAAKKELGMTELYGSDRFLLGRLHVLYSLRSEICDYLTSECLCFVDNKGSTEQQFTAWWKRIRESQIEQYSLDFLKLWRTHERHTDIEKSKRRFCGAVAQLSILKNNTLDTKADFVEDISDALCCLNDNDFYGFAVNPQTKEVPAYDPKDYSTVKKRKKRQYKGIIEKNNIQRRKENESSNSEQQICKRNEQEG